MPTCEDKEVRETLRGAGPCDISYEVLKRSGNPKWWCHTHGMDAAAPDGEPLDMCPGGWLDPVTTEMQLELDLDDGEVALWGVMPPAITIGDPPAEDGKIHVHRRPPGNADKNIDQSYDIVRLRRGALEVTVEGVAAVAQATAALLGREIVALTCSHCGGGHIDVARFATRPHHKHQCNACGREFWDRQPSISNPLANLQETLGLTPPRAPVEIERPLDLDARVFSAAMLWPSNPALVTTSSRPEEIGIHVHAWGAAGERVLDETYYPVVLGGEVLDLRHLRVLSVQRALAHGAPIVALACSGCGVSLLTASEDDWMDPTTTHPCLTCGTVTRTRRRVFANPLAEKGIT